MAQVAHRYHVLRPLRVDLGGEGLETLPVGHVLEPHEVAGWGRSLDALVEQGRLAVLPATELESVTDEELLAELDRRGLHTAAAADDTPKPRRAPKKA